jgi:hypothetical protein
VSFECLTSQINGLSEQVEALILEGDEEQCSALLAQRLVLLEELDLLMRKDKLVSKIYHDFLLSIQHRDREALNMINTSQNKIISDGSHQKKRTNALNTYQKFSE